jgi:hypothetical protein
MLFGTDDVKPIGFPQLNISILQVKQTKKPDQNLLFGTDDVRPMTRFLFQQ